MDTAEFLLETRRSAALEVILSAAAQATPEFPASDAFINPARLGHLKDVMHDLVTCHMALKNCEGASWDAIGGYLGCSRQTAYQRFGRDANYLLQHRQLPRNQNLGSMERLRSTVPDLHTRMEDVEYGVKTLLGDWAAVRTEWAEELRSDDRGGRDLARQPCAAKADPGPSGRR